MSKEVQNRVFILEVLTKRMKEVRKEGSVTKADIYQGIIDSIERLTDDEFQLHIDNGTLKSVENINIQIEGIIKDSLPFNKNQPKTKPQAPKLPEQPQLTITEEKTLEEIVETIQDNADQIKAFVLPLKSDLISLLDYMHENKIKSNVEVFRDNLLLQLL